MGMTDDHLNNLELPGESRADQLADEWDRLELRYKLYFATDTIEMKDFYRTLAEHMLTEMEEKANLLLGEWLCVRDRIGAVKVLESVYDLKEKYVKARLGEK